MQVSQPDEALDMPLRAESQQYLSETLVSTYTGNNAWKPDVTLSLGGKKLPAHKFLLAEYSDVLKAMFQASDRAGSTMTYSKATPDFGFRVFKRPSQTTYALHLHDVLHSQQTMMSSCCACAL